MAAPSAARAAARSSIAPWAASSLASWVATSRAPRECPFERTTREPSRAATPGFELDEVAFDDGQGAHGGAAAAAERLVEESLGVGREVGRVVVDQRGDSQGRAVAGAGLEGDRGLAGGRQEEVERSRDTGREAEAVEAGHGEDDGVERLRVALGQCNATEPCLDVSAERLEPEVGTEGQELTGSTRASTSRRERPSRARRARRHRARRGRRASRRAAGRPRGRDPRPAASGGP